MNIDNYNPFVDFINVKLGLLVTIATFIFGEHWALFLAFFLLNVGDYITGWIKSRILHKTSSKKGADGALKKFGYWIMIMLSFGMGFIFVEIGETIGVDLHITFALGWFVLATLIINEIRSIIENFVESGFKVPKILIDGLEVANKTIDKLSNSNDET